MDKNWNLITVKEGFYFFGNYVESIEGYVQLTEAAMVSQYSSSAGIAGITKGVTDGKIELHTYGKDKVKTIPMENVLSIDESINLYEYAGATVL